MKTTLYLTRHGQTEWNIEKRLQGTGNSPLTKAGIARAEELAKRLETLSIDVIYTSPIERAYHTARLLKGQRDIELITNEGLREMCFGDYEGQRTDDVKALNPAWDVNRIMEGDTTLCAPNGETLEEVRARVAETMNHLIESNRGKTLLIVAHGITLKALMYYFKDKEVNTEVMGQATLTKIEVSETGDYCICYKNDDSHFTIKDKQLGW